MAKPITASMTDANRQNVNQMDSPRMTYAPNPAMQMRVPPANEQRPMEKGSGK